MKKIYLRLFCIALFLLTILSGCGGQGKDSIGLISVKGQSGYVIRIEEEDLDQYFTITEVVSQTSLLDTRDGSRYFVTVAEVTQGGYIAYSNSWMLNVVYLPSATEEQLESAIYYAKPSSDNHMSIEEAAEYLPWLGES